MPNQAPTFIPGKDLRTACYEPINIMEWGNILDAIKVRNSKSAMTGVDMQSVFDRYNASETRDVP